MKNSAFVLKLLDTALYCLPLTLLFAPFLYGSPMRDHGLALNEKNKCKAAGGFFISTIPVFCPVTKPLL